MDRKPSEELATDETHSLEKEGGLDLLNPARIQQRKIPLGLNRYVYVVFLIVLLLFWGPLILSWGQLQEMLEKEGVYRWYCDGSEPNREIVNGSCTYQQEVLGHIGIYGATMYCLGALLGGFIVDEFGPKACCLCGGVCNLLGYTMLAVGSQSVNTFFAYGILLGLSVELVFLGTVSAPNLFPNRKQLVLSLLAMARSASMLLCIAMNRLVSDKFKAKHVAFTLLGVGVLMFVCVATLIPSKAFISSDLLEPGPTPLTANAEPPPFPPLPHKTDATTDHSNIEIREQPPPPPPDKRRRAAYILWGRTLGEPFYFLWLFCDSLLLTRCNFHIVSLSTQHPEVTFTFAVLAGVGFVLCPFTGWCLDTFGSIPVIFVLNCFGTVGFVSLICGSSMAAQVIGVICISVVLSYSGTQNFALMTEFYSQDLVGKLTGLVTFTGGLLTLTNHPIWEWAKLSGHFRSADAIFLGYSAFCTGVICLLWWGPPCLFRNVWSPAGPSALRDSKKRK